MYLRGSYFVLVLCFSLVLLAGVACTNGDSPATLEPTSPSTVTTPTPTATPDIQATIPGVEEALQLNDRPLNEQEFSEAARILGSVNSNESSRLDAVRALQKMPSIATVDSLSTAAIEDPNSRIRVRAVHAIGQIGDDTSIAILEQLVGNSRDPEVRNASRANIYGLRAKYPMSNPPSISIEAVKLEDISKPITVTTTVTSPIDREYARIKLGGQRLWQQHPSPDYPDRIVYYEGPLKAGEPIILTHTVEYLGEPQSNKVIPIPFRVTIGNSDLDHTTYKKHLFVDFRTSPLTASMDAPPELQPKAPREIEIARVGEISASGQSKFSQDTTAGNGIIYTNVSFIRHDNAPIVNTLTHNKVMSADGVEITVEGNITYLDGDSKAEVPTAGKAPSLSDPFSAPAYNLKVEICGLSCNHGWTDSNGAYSINVKATVGTVLTYTLSANNNALNWYMDMECINEHMVFVAKKTVPSIGNKFSGYTFFDDGISVGNGEVVENVGICWGKDDINIHFTQSGVLNLTSVMSIAHDDVADNRDGGDALDEVDVVYCNYKWPSFKAYYDEIYLPCYKVDGKIPAEMQKYAGNNKAVDAAYKDHTLAHEYYHHVQREIASYGYSGGGSHTYCTGEKQKLAFSEGTANYFAAHIVANNPKMAGGSGGYWLPRAEHACGDESGDIRVEGFITQAMWDLADGIGTKADGWDTVDGADGWDTVDGNEIEGHRLIMQVLDNELDVNYESWNWFWEDDPTGRNLGHFYNAWIDRTGESGQFALDSILSRLGIARKSTKFDGEKNLPQLVIGAVLEFFEFTNLFPVPADLGKMESDEEYLYEVDLASTTPLSVRRDYSYIGSHYLCDGAYTIRQKLNGRFLDAYEAGNGHSVVTRKAQYDDSQKWILTSLGSNNYTIQQKVNGRFLDAWENDSDPDGDGVGNDFSAVTRDPEYIDAGKTTVHDSQIWVLTPLSSNSYTIQQKVNNLFLDAWEHDDDPDGDGVGNDYSAVTRGHQGNDSQRWIVKCGNDELTARIGLTNLNPGNMSAGAAPGSSSQSDSADFDVIIPPSANSWLAVSPTTDAFDPRVLSELVLSFDPDQIGVEQMVIAEVKLEFKTYAIGSGWSVETSSDIKVTLNVLDGPDDDYDKDGLTSRDEIYRYAWEYGCLNPADADSDGDGINDGDEISSVSILGTADENVSLPCNPDTDSDGIDDGYESKHECMKSGIADSEKDADGDGLTNLQEYKGEGIVGALNARSNPCLADSDGDGRNDPFYTDNCVMTSNSEQENHDDDPLGDACDTDDDNDNCPDDGDYDPLHADPTMECYKAPYSTRLMMGLIDPIWDLIQIPNEEYMILSVGPKPFGDGWCGRIACPPPHVRIVDRTFNVIQEIHPKDFGFSSESGFGLSMTWVEDLDRDGVKDLAIGVPYAQAYGALGNTGAMLVVSGKTGQELGRISGFQQGGHFGASMAALGSNQLAVGAPGQGVLNRNAGAVSIIDLDQFAVMNTYNIGSSNDRFGHSLFGIPDMDNDGIGELLIGAPNHSGVGAVFLAKSKGGNLAKLAEGTSQNSLFGQTITSGGDITGDGVIDVLVGAPNESGTGTITLFDIHGRQEWSVKGLGQGSEFGSSIAALMDSGRQETDNGFIVGAPGNDGNKGAAYIVSATGRFSLFSSGESRGVRAGESVASLSGLGQASDLVYVVSQMDVGTNMEHTLFSNRTENIK